MCASSISMHSPFLMPVCSSRVDQQKGSRIGLGRPQQIACHAQQRLDLVVIEDFGQRCRRVHMDQRRGGVFVEHLGCGEPAEEDLERGQPPRVGLGTARHVALGAQPGHELFEVRLTDLADGLVRADVPAQRAADRPGTP